jgi:uncharacterized HhH-GPD family protein
MRNLYLAAEPEADALLATDPLALLIGALLDQQVPLERAFRAPHQLARRLGMARLDAAAIAAYDPEAFTEIFAAPPALHRFPAAMAARTQQLCRAVVSEYGGDAAAVWRGAVTGQELVERVGALPGFGRQKAQIFAALLGKQLGFQPEGWREAAGPYGEEGVHRSAADVTDEASLAKVRDYKKQARAAAKAAKGGGGGRARAVAG